MCQVYLCRAITLAKHAHPPSAPMRMLVCPLRAPTRTKASSAVEPASAKWRSPTSSRLTSAACLSLESPTILLRKPSGVRYLGVRHLFRRLRRSTALIALVDMQTACLLRLGHPVCRTAYSRCGPIPPQRRHAIQTVTADHPVLYAIG